MDAQVSTHTTLLRRLAQGNDEVAWREFCDRYGELILSFARRQGAQPADCDDDQQEVLVGLWRVMRYFKYDEKKGKFRSYLKTATLRAVFQRLRQKAGRRTIGSYEEALSEAKGDDALEAIWEEEWRSYHVRLAMKTINNEFTEATRAAFRACAVEGKKAQEVAEALGMNLNQVYKAKSNVTKRLRVLIDRQIEEEG